MNLSERREMFRAYVASYDLENVKIRLKYDHTFRVADLSLQIAESLGLSQEETELAWTIGLLHDIGRFEQLKRYNTFQDAVSIDHAAFGADLLFEDGLVEGYQLKPEELPVVEAAIRYHNRYRIPEGLDEKTLMFCKIIRDADKIDILKVFSEVSLEECYDCTTKELKQFVVTDAVMEAFMEEHAVERSLHRNALDHMIGHAALVFELEYPVSRIIMKQQGNLEKMICFSSDNPETQKQLGQVREKLREFLSREV